MVRRCCVPGCKSSSRMPNHRLPNDREKSEKWLRTIGLHDMIDAPKELVSKLRICTLHFADDMIIPVGSKRKLMHNALPTLLLVQPESANDTIQPESANDMVQHEIVECMATTSNMIPKPDPPVKEIVLIKRVQNIKYRQLRQKLNKCLRQLRRKKARKSKKTDVSSTDIWEKATADFPIIQKTFFKIISDNFKRLPEENINSDPVLIPLSSKLLLNNKFNERENYTSVPKRRRIRNICDSVKCDIVKEGHRYTSKQKALCITLYKTMGKRGYTCLRNVFKHIPSVQTLQASLKQIPLVPGLNPFIVEHLKTVSAEMSTHDKVSILMWDEVSIQPHLQYDTQRDVICGLEDWGNNRTNKIADHVLVFMLRGLYTGWKMPISFNFCAKTTNTPQLMRCVKQHISVVSKAGFPIVATVCDQGACNMAAIKELVAQTDRQRSCENRNKGQTFEVNGMEIVPLYDPPHLIKGIRNNLLTKDLKFQSPSHNGTSYASWDVIRTAWVLDKRTNLIRPQLSKLTKEHIVESHIKKMRVKHATQVLSGTVASRIEALARCKCTTTMDDGNLVKIDYDEGIATAEAVDFFNNLFDSVNGTDVTENKLRCVTTVDSAHHEFWKDAKATLRSMSFVDKITHEHVKTVPTLRNWLFTINGFQKLFQVLQNKFDINVLKTRFCNQDSLENFFGQIRSHAVRNINPTPQQFMYSFGTLLLTSFKCVKIVGGNCEATGESFLCSIEKCLQRNILEKDGGVHDACTENNDDDDEPEKLFSDTNVPPQSVNQFLTENLENIIREIIKKCDLCQVCEDSLKQTKFPTIAKQIIQRVLKLLETRCHLRNITKVFSKHFDNWDINMDWHECTEHNDILQIMLKKLIISTLTWWCRKKNVFLRECTDSTDYHSLCVQATQKVKKARELYNLQKRKKI